MKKIIYHVRVNLIKTLMKEALSLKPVSKNGI